MKLVEKEDNVGILAGFFVLGVFVVIALFLPWLFPQFRLGIGGIQGNVPDEMLVIVPVFQGIVIATVITAVLGSVTKIMRQRKEVVAK